MRFAVGPNRFCTSINLERTVRPAKLNPTKLNPTKLNPTKLNPIKSL